MRLVLLVSSDPSDIYFANRIASRFETIGVVVEHQDKTNKPSERIRNALKLSLRPKAFLDKIRSNRLNDRYRQLAREADLEGFGDQGFELRLPNHCARLDVRGKGAINSADTIETLRRWNPHLIAVCGTSLLKEGVLSVAPGRVLNLHGGLSQRYRGTWTTHWAVVNEEPEYIGATVHYVSSGVDDGDIVRQGRPCLDGTENPEMLYVKVVRLGVEMMTRSILEIESGIESRFRPEVLGRLYLGRMVTPEVLRTAWENTERGVVRKYLADKESRDAAVIQLLRGNRKGAG